jgi:hypothetical protein
VKDRRTRFAEMITSTIPNITNDAGSGMPLLCWLSASLPADENNTFSLGLGTGGGRAMTADRSASTCSTD